MTPSQIKVGGTYEGAHPLKDGPTIKRTVKDLTLNSLNQSIAIFKCDGCEPHMQHEMRLNAFAAWVIREVCSTPTPCERERGGRV